MSDDEVLRRRAPALALAGLVAVAGLGWFIQGRVSDDARAFDAFCSATHVGEAREHVSERAQARGYAFQKQGCAPPRPGVEAWLATAEVWGYRAACVVELERGRVVSRRLAELP